jgi:hypothetical protein
MLWDTWKLELELQVNLLIVSQITVKRHTTHLQQVLPSSAISKLAGSIFQANIMHKNAGEMNNTI